jgi:hypothetical protein
VLVHTKQRIALAGMQTDLPNGLDDKTPPPLSKSFKNLKHFVKLLLAEMNLRGGDVRVAVQGLQDQNRMMGALAENDEVRACACVGFGVGWVVGGWGGGCASQTSQSNLHHSHTHTHTYTHTHTHIHTRIHTRICTHTQVKLQADTLIPLVTPTEEPMPASTSTAATGDSETSRMLQLLQMQVKGQSEFQTSMLRMVGRFVQVCKFCTH